MRVSQFSYKLKRTLPHDIIHSHLIIMTFFKSFKTIFEKLSTLYIGANFICTVYVITYLLIYYFLKLVKYTLFKNNMILDHSKLKLSRNK